MPDAFHVVLSVIDRILPHASYVYVAWIAPLVVLTLCFPGGSWKRRFAAVGISVVVFFAVITPWMCRNHALGAGYTLDTNTGAMLHQNGAMLQAAVNGTDFESEKAKLLAEQEELFRDTTAFPDEASRESWRMRRLLGMIAEHPFLWFSQHFDWHILLPDVPTLSELFGATTPGRGTMGVLAADGIVKLCGRLRQQPPGRQEDPIRSRRRPGPLLRPHRAR